MNVTDKIPLFMDHHLLDYGCAIQRDILVQGRLYISENHMCFHANIFGWVTNVRQRKFAAYIIV